MTTPTNDNNGWIAESEYEKYVMETLGDKPVIKMLVNAGIPFSKWKSNIHNLVDKATGATREVRFKLPAKTPQQ